MFQAQGTVINNRVYVGGGSTDTDNTNYCVYEYDPAPDCWQCLPHTSVSFFGLSQLENELVIVGGRQKDWIVSDTTFLFDRFSQRWKTSLPPLITPRHSPTCLSQDTTLTISGGLTYSGNIVSSIEVIRTDDFQWNVVGFLSRSALLCYPSPTVVNDSYYLLGGYTSMTACSVTNSCHFASLETLSSRNLDPYMWHSLPDTPTLQTTAACLNGYLLALGGSTTPYSKPLHCSVYAYCPYLDSWELVGELPCETCHSTVVSLNQHEILLMGGWVQPGEFKRCNTVYRGKFV